jgi:hypothetical protein
MYFYDPFGELCERMLIVLSCLVMMAALSVYCVYTAAKYKLIFTNLAFQRGYAKMHFFLRLKWNRIYWRHIYWPLYLLGLRPALTDAYLESRRAKLRASLP